MLDAIEPTTDYLTPQQAVARGDQLARHAIRDPDALYWAIHHYMLAQAGYEWIIHRLCNTEVDTDELERWSAAWAVARHAARCGLSAKRIAHLLGRLCVWLPSSPDEPDEIASIARAAISEVSA